MSNIDVLTYGFSLSSNQGNFGWSTISLLRVNGTHILIDTGPSSRRRLLLSTMKSHGLEPNDIDIVILTHLHWDHCQNTDLFSNSKILVHPKELDYAKSPKRGDWATVPLINEVLSKMSVNPVSDGDKVTDGVRIVDTPGHTSGHMSVSVESDKGNIIVSGDALSDVGSITRGLPQNVFYDKSQATDSIQKMVDTSKIFYPGHDRPFKIGSSSIEYIEGPTDVEIVNSIGNSEIVGVSYKVQRQLETNIEITQK